MVLRGWLYFILSIALLLASFTAPYGALAGNSNRVLAATPNAISFAPMYVGSTQTLQVTLTNYGNASLKILSAQVTGAGFSFDGLTTPLTLAAGKSTAFKTSFAPRTQGAAQGSITISSNSNAPLVLALSGDTLDPIQITTTSLPGGQQGSTYKVGLVASGGQIPYKWSIASGTMSNFRYTRELGAKLVYCSSAGLVKSGKKCHSRPEYLGFGDRFTFENRNRICAECDQFSSIF
jgi:hypothetical protein